jgi:small subunit ribosomal protein S17
MEDSVLIRNCPPVSARKRFTLEKIVRSPATESDLAHAAAVEPLAASPTPTATP